MPLSALPSAEGGPNVLHGCRIATILDKHWQCRLYGTRDGYFAQLS